MPQGAYRWLGNAPVPDPARVEAIDAAYDDAAVPAFAEPARAAAVERVERALATARTGDLTEAAAHLTYARTTLAGLDPSALQPRRGLGGLFDSRGGRLKRFRQAYVHAASGVEHAAAELTGRVDGAARRAGVLNDVWTDLRDAVADLDAHLAAAARRLAGQAPNTGDAPPHPLHDRRGTLDVCRAAALGSLPLIRGTQTADARAAEAMKACAEGMARWREDWKEALGLTAKRPKKIQPDLERLTLIQDELMDRIDRALAELTTARAYRADVEGRMAELRQRL